MKRVSDIFAFSNVLIAVYIFILALREENSFPLLIGIIGSIILFISQIYYLYNVWRKR